MYSLDWGETSEAPYAHYAPSSLYLLLALFSSFPKRGEYSEYRVYEQALTCADSPERGVSTCTQQSRFY